MTTPLLRPSELDAYLGYPPGRSERLARRGLIPCIIIPSGEIRFDRVVIHRWIAERTSKVTNAKQNGVKR